MPFVPPDPLNILAALRAALADLRQLAEAEPHNAPTVMAAAVDLEAAIAKLEPLAKPARAV
jgi:hypothetical protein